MNKNLALGSLCHRISVATIALHKSLITFFPSVAMATSITTHDSNFDARAEAQEPSRKQ
jgi:hypothetical protein